MTTINSSLFSDKKLQSFLLLLLKEVELKEINAESIKSIGIKYKKLKTIFDDDDEIKKYLEYSDKKGFIRLEFISKQQIRDKKIPNEVYISKITPDHTLIKPEVFYEVKRYYKINFYPNDVFIFKYNKHNIQKIKKFFSGLDENSNKTKLNLSELSTENLIKIQKVLKIVLDELEIQEINRLTGNKVLVKKFEKEDIYYTDAEAILNKIDGVKVLDAELNQIYGKENIIDPFYTFGITKNDLAQYLFWTGSPSYIREIKKKIDRKLKEKAKARGKEVRKQFEELDGKQKEKESLKKEIIEELEGKKKTQDNKRPFCMVENNWGYLKFDKYGEKIKIGTPKSRHFRLLECLLEPLGKAKTIETVYDWIKLPKDKKDSDLSGWDNYKKKNRQMVIIQNTIKELQKGNKLRKKLAFEFDDTKTKIWIKSLE